jgi:hypothetical protein
MVLHQPGVKVTKQPARALGIEIPSGILSIADDVID